MLVCYKLLLLLLLPLTPHLLQLLPCWQQLGVILAIRSTSFLNSLVCIIPTLKTHLGDRNDSGERNNRQCMEVPAVRATKEAQGLKDDARKKSPSHCKDQEGHKQRCSCNEGRKEATPLWPLRKRECQGQRDGGNNYEDQQPHKQQRHCENAGGQAQDFATDHHPLAAGVPILHAASRVSRIVVPTHILQFLAAHPAPFCTTTTRHVVASFDLFDRCAAFRARPGTDRKQIHTLLPSACSLICLTCLGTRCMCARVVEAEGAIALLTTHFRQRLTIVTSTGHAKCLALWTFTDQGISCHPRKAPILCKQVVVKPASQVLLRCHSTTAIVAG